MTTRDQLFPSNVVAAAKLAQTDTGCLASVALAQWAIESGYGKYPCAQNNFWGMKWFTGCKYPFQVRTTHEHVNDRWITIEARFQSFPDMPTGFIEHGKLLMDVNGPYRSALPFKNDWRAFVQHMAPRYATDPKYSDKLIDVIRQFKLTDFDNLS